MRTSTQVAEARRPILFALVGVAVLAAALAVWLLVGSQGEQSVAAGEGEVLAQADDDEAEDATDSIEAATIDVTYDAFLGRDPFESIRPEEPAAPADTGNGDTGNGDTGNGDTGNGDTGNGDTGNGDTGNGTPANGQLMIEVVEVTDTGARIQIGSTVYAPNVGDVFGDDLRLVRIIDDCVELQQGDQLLPILCTGEATAK